jgi:hypothetical protein
MTLRSTGSLVAAGAVLVLGCFGGPALAQGMGSLSGNLTAGYSRYDVSGKSADAWSGAGSAVLTLDNPGGNIQANFLNSDVNTIATKKLAGTSTDDWGYGGDAYWRDYAGEFGVNITQNTIVKSSRGEDLSGGFFGEFYALSDLTLRAKGGRLQGGADGWYGDTGLAFYPAEQLAISITGDYARLKNNGPEVTDAAFGIEYLPVRDVPVSLSLGYTYARYEHTGALGGDTNIFSVALKAYLGGGGRNGGLVDYQRNGATNWDGAPATIAGIGF